jgi:curli production assembly/transport component CsgF
MTVCPQPSSQFTRRLKRLHATVAVASILMLADQASASELVYQPINPAFGGNPFNGSFLLETAKIQNGHEANSNRTVASGLSSGIGGTSDQQQFVRILQSRLLSDMASKVADAIFGESAQDSGEFRYGSQVVSFSRGIDSISIDIFNETTGERTQISVPSSVQ